MRIRTERLLLREFVFEDWAAVLAYQSKPLYLRYYPWERRTPPEAQAFVRLFLSWQTEEPRRRFQLAIVLPDGDRLIGNCGIRRATAEAHEAELGYELAPAYWGQGYATEAGRAMLAVAFQILKLHRVVAHVLAENGASVHVLEKLGLQREGRLRENEWFKGRWWDTLLYAALEYEWHEQLPAYRSLEMP